MDNASILRLRQTQRELNDYLVFYTTVAASYADATVAGNKARKAIRVTQATNRLIGRLIGSGGTNATQREVEQIYGNIDELNIINDQLDSLMKRDAELKKTIGKISKETGLSPDKFSVTSELMRDVVNNTNVDKSKRDLSAGALNKITSFDVDKLMLGGITPTVLGPYASLLIGGAKMLKSTPAKLLGKGLWGLSKLAGKGLWGLGKGMFGGGFSSGASSTVGDVQSPQVDVRTKQGAELAASPLALFFDKIAFKSKWTKDVYKFLKGEKEDKGSWLGSVLKGLGLATLAGLAWEGLKWLSGVGWEGLKWLSGVAWEGLKWLSGITWEGLKWLASATWTGLKWLAGVTWDGLKWLAGVTWTGLKWLAGVTWDGLKWVVKQSWDGLKWLAKQGWEGLKSLSKVNWDGVVKKLGLIAPAASTIAIPTATTLALGIPASVGILKSLPLTSLRYPEISQIQTPLDIQTRGGIRESFKKNQQDFEAYNKSLDGASPTFEGFEEFLRNQNNISTNQLEISKKQTTTLEDIKTFLKKSSENSNKAPVFSMNNSGTSDFLKRLNNTYFNNFNYQSGN